MVHPLEKLPASCTIKTCGLVRHYLVAQNFVLLGPLLSQPECFRLTGHVPFKRGLPLFMECSVYCNHLSIKTMFKWPMGGRFRQVSLYWLDCTNITHRRIR